jgi:hypothetical protein
MIFSKNSGRRGDRSAADKRIHAGTTISTGARGDRWNEIKLAKGTGGRFEFKNISEGRELDPLGEKGAPAQRYDRNQEKKVPRALS